VAPLTAEVQYFQMGLDLTAIVCIDSWQQSIMGYFTFQMIFGVQHLFSFDMVLYVWSHMARPLFSFCVGSGKRGSGYPSIELLCDRNWQVIFDELWSHPELPRLVDEWWHFFPDPTQKKKAVWSRETTVCVGSLVKIIISKKLINTIAQKFGIFKDYSRSVESKLE